MFYKRHSGIKQILVLNQLTIPIIVFLIIGFVTFAAILSQQYVENDAFKIKPIDNISNAGEEKNKYEIYKLAAEIRKIRSDTSGSLFWLRLVALFVTVGGAVGGYLIGQSKVTRDK
jgi:hypothetical protein